MSLDKYDVDKLSYKGLFFAWGNCVFISKTIVKKNNSENDIV